MFSSFVFYVGLTANSILIHCSVNVFFTLFRNFLFIWFLFGICYFFVALFLLSRPLSNPFILIYCTLWQITAKISSKYFILCTRNVNSKSSKRKTNKTLIKSKNIGFSAKCSGESVKQKAVDSIADAKSNNNNYLGWMKNHWPKLKHTFTLHMWKYGIRKWPIYDKLLA